jgi:hypothetical protein
LGLVHCWTVDFEALVEQQVKDAERMSCQSQDNGWVWYSVRQQVLEAERQTQQLIKGIVTQLVTNLRTGLASRRKQKNIFFSQHRHSAAR